LPGLLELAEKSNSQRLIGSLAAGHILAEAQFETLIRLFLCQGPIIKQSEDVIGGALGVISDERIMESIRRRSSAPRLLEIFLPLTVYKQVQLRRKLCIRPVCPLILLVIIPIYTSNLIVQ